MDNILDFIKVSPEAIALVDAKRFLLVASKKIYSIFGLPTLIANRKKMELEQRFQNEQSLQTKLQNAMKKIKSSSTPVYFSWQNKEKIYDISVNYFTWKKEKMYQVIFNDVSYKFKTSSPYALSRQFLETILNDLPVGVTVIDELQHIFVANKTQLEFFARMQPNGPADISEVVGFKVCDIFPDFQEASWDKLVASVLEANDQVPVQFIDTYEDSVFQYTIARFMNEDSRSPSAVIIAEDVTEKVAMESELKVASEQATKLEALELINVSLRHKIYNVITPISMNAELIKHSIPDEGFSDIENMSEAIINEVKRLHTFIEKLSAMNEVKTVSYLDSEDEQMLNIEE